MSSPYVHSKEARVKHRVKLAFLVKRSAMIPLLSLLLWSFVGCSTTRTHGSGNDDSSGRDVNVGDLHLLRIPMTLRGSEYLLTSDPDSVSTHVDTAQVLKRLTRPTDDCGLNLYSNHFGDDWSSRYFEADSLKQTTYVFVFDDGTNREVAAALIVNPTDDQVVVVPKANLDFLLNRAMFDHTMPRRLILATYEVYGFVGDSLIMAGKLKF